MPDSQKYSGLGYWIGQFAFSALLAILGLAGGVYMLIDSGSENPSSSTGVGEGAIVLLVGIVFLLLLIWLIVSFVAQSRQQRAVYAWAIMQDYVSRNPGARAARPGRAVRGDIASMATAARARDGALSYEEVLRLQALRPEVPYPGDLEALRLAAAAPSQIPDTPQDRERRRAEWAADDGDARARLDAAGLGRPGLVRRVRLVTRVVGWAAVAVFLASAWLKSPAPATTTFLVLLGLWCVLRLVTGLLQDARTRRGRALAHAWLSDAEKSDRGLPTPFDEFFETSFGAWWIRLLTPMALLGVFFLLGGLANIGRASDPVERVVFVGMACAAAGFFFASIALRIVAARRAAVDRDRLRTYRRGREALSSEEAETARRGA